MQGLIPFKFESNEIRTVVENDQIWVVAKDVLLVLGYSEESNPSRVISLVPEIWRGVKPIHTPGGTQQISVLSEQGLYFFLGRSDKRKALPFQMWIAGEVVPSIRKTGNYSTPKTQLEILQNVVAVMVEQEKRIAVVEEKQRIVEGKLEDFSTGAEHFSVTAYHKLFLVQQISNSQANSDGRLLSLAAKNQGIELGKAPHPVWGTVNTYPKALLDAYYRGEYEVH